MLYYESHITKHNNKKNVWTLIRYFTSVKAIKKTGMLRKKLQASLQSQIIFWNKARSLSPSISATSICLLWPFPYLKCQLLTVMLNITNSKYGLCCEFWNCWHNIIIMILYLHMFVNNLDFPAQSQIQINYR